MPKIPADNAVNIALCVYNIGKPGRREKLVIRVRRGGNESSKKAKETLDYRDSTQAGRFFGLEETEIKNIPKKELVVVVGERVLGDITIDPKKNAGTNEDMSNAFKNALPSADPDNVQVLVRRIDDKLGNLFILSDKQNGLCSLRQFPASSDREIFYYPEWAKVGRNFAKTPRERKSKWSNSITEFCTTWLHENSNTIPDHFNKSNKEQPSSCTQTEFELIVSSLKKSVACYKDTGNREHLSHMLLEVQKGLAHQPPEESDKDDLKIVNNLITGPEMITFEEAEDAAEAFQRLWSVILPGDLKTVVTPEALFNLCTGLRGGILDTKPILKENRYQQFVSTFCILFERSHVAPYPSSQRDADIIAAYCSARMSAVSDIGLKMTPVKVESPEGVALTEMQQRVKEYEVYIELLDTRIDSLSHNYPSQPNNLFNKGLPQLFQDFSNTFDIDMAREYMSHITHALVMDEKATLSSLREMFVHARGISSARMLAYTKDVHRSDEPDLSSDEKGSENNDGKMDFQESELDFQDESELDSEQDGK
ncbi:unnamed protein product [Clonostachys rosea f. rosea IK726]|uniref:Uncharacterized protein n=2 Tax=Bionectria ochroleuca TaxID=29856 RepID=A0ACA9T9B6_BIOOC|nr:unnamed protein product [Clonostachys rosea f. rosea IK726]